MYRPLNEPMNPLLDAFLRYRLKIERNHGGTHYRYKTHQRYVDRRGDVQIVDLRWKCCLKYGWDIPNEELALAIASHTNDERRLVEVGAGTGYLAWYLHQFGMDIEAYDISPYESTWTSGKWFPVKVANSGVSSEHPDRALLLCWPPMNTRMASAALAAYEGDTLIYIGEKKGGCTADDAFFDTLKRDWDCVYENYPHNWMSIYSAHHIYKRK